MTKESELNKQLTTELVVFDFDKTIIDCNSDTYINILAPNGKIPDEFWKTEYEDDWTAYVQQVFIYLYQNGSTEQDYKQCLDTIPLIPGMENLLHNLSKGTNSKRFETIIISDANTYFIRHILANYKLLDCFKEIFTNPASFDESGCLRIGHFHEQSHCKLSPVNLCKGQVLKDYIAKRTSENVRFDRIFYAGDGANDLCPSLMLGANDYVFPRYNFHLHRLAMGKLETNELKAKLIPFVTGEDIWNAIIKS